MKKLTDLTIVKSVIEDIKSDMADEDIIHLLLEKKISTIPDNPTKIQKLTDKIAAFGGSWLFVNIFLILILMWMLFNTFSTNQFDPYPFILLNLFLSCISALQAPIIMMAQNREAKKDRIQNDHDYKINLKNEIILQDLHMKLDRILEKLDKKTE